MKQPSKSQITCQSCGSSNTDPIAPCKRFYHNAEIILSQCRNHTLRSLQGERGLGGFKTYYLDSSIMKSWWRRVAIAKVELGLMEYKAQAILLNEPIIPKNCKRWISLNKYPFVGRELHPYRIWLNECKQIPVFLGTHRPMREYHLWRRQTFYLRSPQPSPGQLSLFEI